MFRNNTIKPLVLNTHFISLIKSFNSKYYLYKNLIQKNNEKNNNTKVLSLNFKRKRFFPSIRTMNGNTLSFISLGMIASRYNRGKPFYRKKPIFIKVASLIRKLLIYTFLKNVHLFIRRSPVFLIDILMTIINPALSIYQNPLKTNQNINERMYTNGFFFSKMFFFSTKPFGFMKTGKKGRLKRKIRRKVILKNRILD